MLDASCRSSPPDLFDTDSLTPGHERIEAQMLCAGCPVVAECAEDALRPVNVSAFIHHLSGVDVDSDDDWVSQSGVVRAGEPM